MKNNKKKYALVIILILFIISVGKDLNTLHCLFFLAMYDDTHKHRK